MKVALITGGGSGIGLAAAQEFQANGYQVAICGRSLEKLKAAASVLEPGILAIPADVSQSDDVERLYSLVTERWGGVDVLVNNAAVYLRRAVAEHSLSDWNQVMGVNVTGSFLCAQKLFIQRMNTGRGKSVVNVGSVAGLRGVDKFPGASSYIASKYAVVGLTEALALEGRPLGIRVNCIAPGAVDTEMLRTAAPQYETDLKPKDIAKLILFLAEEERSGVLRGSTLEVFSK